MQYIDLLQRHVATKILSHSFNKVLWNSCLHMEKLSTQWVAVSVVRAVCAVAVHANAVLCCCNVAVEVITSLFTVLLGG